MSGFDDRLKGLLSAEDEAFIDESLNEDSYYKEAFASLSGPGRGMNIMAWIGVFIFSGVILYSIFAFFQADTVKDQIMWAALAIMGNTAQIAMKLWFHNRLNRFAIVREIKRLQLEIARSSSI
ncbi:DUF6768 family protein [Hirschia litorea]|uniref:DUF6768 family protein n=1 Tax=Hirschia litorea TaxID=1199156 RepID=A0ABW2IKT5_9PROT